MRLDKQLSDLREMPENWNGYGEKRITERALAAADSLHFSPTSDGGLQIELNTRHARVEVCIDPDGEVYDCSWGPQHRTQETGEVAS